MINLLKLNIFALLLPFMMLSTQVLADTASDTETLLNWAENTRPELFPGRKSTQTLDSWIFRYYPETDIYVGVNTGDSGVYVLGGPWGETPTYIESLANIISSIDIDSSDYLCRDHIAAENNVVGNNTYEFIANAGECFGTVEDFGLTKQEFPVSIDLGNNSEELISLSPTAKLTSELITTIAPSGGYQLRVAIEMSNTSLENICIDFHGASLRNLAGGEIADMGRLNIFGDMYYGEASGGVKYHSDCVPAGQTRTVWGSVIISHEAFPGSPEAPTLTIESFATLDHIVVVVDDLDIPEQRSDDYFLEPLIPSEAVWSTEHEVIQNIDYYGYKIVNSFLNMTNHPVIFNTQLVHIVYFDEEGYINYDSLSSIAEFLGIDSDDLTDSDFRLDAMGGTLSVQDQYFPIVPSRGATTIVGRSKKAVISLDICDKGITPIIPIIFTQFTGRTQCSQF